MERERSYVRTLVGAVIGAVVLGVPWFVASVRVFERRFNAAERTNLGFAVFLIIALGGAWAGSVFGARVWLRRREDRLANRTALLLAFVLPTWVVLIGVIEASLRVADIHRWGGWIAFLSIAVSSTIVPPIAARAIALRRVPVITRAHETKSFLHRSRRLGGARYEGKGPARRRS